MKRINAEGEHEDIDPFDQAPDEFAFFIRDRWLPAIKSGSGGFHDRGYSLVPHLERDAIEALADLMPGLPRRPVLDTDALPAHVPPDTYDRARERWREVWTSETWFYTDRFDLPSKQQAAARILQHSSQLRSAVADGQAEKAAALGMLLAFEAIGGGYALKIEATNEALKVVQRARRTAYRKGVGKKQPALDRSEDACIAAAKNLWSEQPQLRIGEVAKQLRQMLIKNLDKLPSLSLADVPGTDTVKTWLKDASKAGKLAIPSGAQRRGRPTKQSKK